MKQSFNPILPLNVYIPDGEPHVFGDRIYLFGSHDAEGGTRYCAEENYLGWSAPLDNPSDWHCDGEIYRSSQDPDYIEGVTNDLYAPDVVQGNDGRFYLYYNLVTASASATGNDSVKVAVCDTPAGQYQYLGFVRNPDGSPCKDYLMGDPAVINDDGIIRLYCGWSLSMVAAEAHAQGSGYSGESNQHHTHEQPQMKLPPPGDPAMNQVLAPVYQMLFKRSAESVARLIYPLMGANTLELADDMLTVVSEVRRIVPGQFDTPEDSSFFGHAFYEAASIRKINGQYYFIYSSENSHELCYATSQYPDRDFVYGGTIISNGDVGYNGLVKEARHNMTANDHGSLAQINGQWYIFHHRQTHKSTFSRQACVEPITINDDGSINQVECTSQGFNNGPLAADGLFPAPICCMLTNGHMPHCTNTKLAADLPFITHDAQERYITGIKDGTLIGYKYFNFAGKTELVIKTRGPGEGKFVISTNQGAAGEIPISAAEDWRDCSLVFTAEGVDALYFTFHGQGMVEFHSFILRS